MQLIVIISVIALFLMAQPIFSEEQVDDVTAYLNYSISMTWDGIPFQPLDNNERLYPLVYDGRTYLPARYIADKAGVNVNWDSETQTVVFTTQDEENPSEDKQYVPYKDTDNGNTNTPDGTTSMHDTLLGVTSFELEIEAQNGNAIEVEFEGRDDLDEYEITFETKDGKKELKGSFALEEIAAHLSQIDINQDIPRDELVTHLVRAFNFNVEDITDFELEIEFTSGYKIEIEGLQIVKDSETNDDGLPFSEFELEIENKEMSFKVEYDKGKFELEIEKENGEELELEGEAAKDRVYPILKDLDIDSGLSSNELIDKVLGAFDWEGDYEEIELEIKFDDGTEFEFEKSVLRKPQ